MADRLGIEHRLLEGVGRADVGLRRAGLDGNAVADAGVFDDAAGDDFSVLDEIIERTKAAQRVRSPVPELIFWFSAGPPWKLTSILCPLAFSNADASSRTPDSVAWLR
jgi:hypothetical protein